MTKRICVSCGKEKDVSGGKNLLSLRQTFSITASPDIKLPSQRPERDKQV